MGEGADIRLRAVAELTQAMAAAQRFCEAHPRHSAHREVVHAAAVRACAALNGSFASLSVLDRARGLLDVLVNVGQLAPGESVFPDDESYPVHDFPQIAGPLPEGWPGADGGGPPAAWIETAAPGGPAAASPASDVPSRNGRSPSARAAALRRRGRGSCVVAPIVLRGRAWGELYVARDPGAPVFDRVDAHFAAVLAEVISAGIAQNEQLEEVRRLAFTDELTGLANRRAVEGTLDDGLERHRADGTVVSLAVCDVNGLKRVNDERGHAAGDRLLERFGMVLSLAGAQLPGALAARLGGDEFCLLTVGPSADQAVRAAEEVCRRALALRDGDGVSCGVASTGDQIGPVRSAARLFRLADAAQYRAKAARALAPVVAGREGGPEDPVVRLADASQTEGEPPSPPPGERRHFRGHTAKPDGPVPPEESAQPRQSERSEGPEHSERPDGTGELSGPASGPEAAAGSIRTGGPYPSEDATGPHRRRSTRVASPDL